MYTRQFLSGFCDMVIPTLVAPALSELSIKSQMALSGV
jgi:hypothetical protein